MRAYLVQHGEAVSEQVDPARPLSEKGRKDVAKVAALLRESSLSVSVIFHSGKTRAAQTAEGLATGVAAPRGIFPKAGIAPNDPVAPLRDELEKSPEDILVVGHLPFLSTLAAALLGGEEGKELVAFQTGGIVCLERTGPAVWKIQWMLVPDILP